MAEASAGRRRGAGAAVAHAVRGANWWSSKLPPLFGLAFLQVLRHDVEPARAMLLLGSVLVVTGGSVGAWGHVLNDWFDVEADRRAGRPNRMDRLPVAARAALAGGLAVSAFAPALLVGYGTAATILLGVELLLPVLYSMPPVRLKERGLAGVLADAAAAHAVPAMIVMTAFAAGSTSGGESPLVLALVAAWSACLGLNGILWHQRLDRDSDRRAGARTFATAAGPAALDRLLGRLWGAEAATFVALVAVLAPSAPLVAAALAAYLVLDGLKLALGWEWRPGAGRAELARRRLPLLSNGFYELWLPLAAALQLAPRGPVFALLPVLVVALFSGNLRREAAETAALFRDLAGRRQTPRPTGRDGWTLETFEGARARLVRRPGGARGLRVEIADPGRECWHVKLSRGPFRLTRGAAAELRAEMRAERVRPVTWSAVRTRPPWDSLGLSEELEIGPGGRSALLRFVATEDADADLCLLVGGSSAGVEIAEVELVAVPPGGTP